MKTLFLLLLLCASAALHAQSTFSNTGSGLNDISRFIDPRDSISDDNDIVSDKAGEDAEETSLENATMEVTTDAILFDHLPNRLVTAHITDADGELLLSRSVSNNRNAISIGRMGEGLFYITLIYKDQRRGFTIERYP